MGKQVREPFVGASKRIVWQGPFNPFTKNGKVTTLRSAILGRQVVA